MEIIVGGWSEDLQTTDLSSLERLISRLHNRLDRLCDRLNDRLSDRLETWAGWMGGR